MKSGFRWRCMGLLTMVLLLWPLMAAAAPLPAERSGPTLTARGQEDQLHLSHRHAHGSQLFAGHGQTGTARRGDLAGSR